jgi:hypothetical protein
MKKNRKKIIIIVAAVFLIAVIATLAIYIFNSNSNSSDVKTLSTNKSVKTLRDEAEAARKANDKTKAKLLLSQAKQKLSEQPESDANTNAKVDVAAQQCMLGVKSACKGY